MKKEYGKEIPNGEILLASRWIKKRFHPTLIYKKTMIKTYIILYVLHLVRKERRKLFENIHPTSNEECYLLNNPRCTKRKSFRICNKRDKITIKRIQKKK